MKAHPLPRLMLAFLGLSLAAAAVVMAARRAIHADARQIGRIR